MTSHPDLAALLRGELRNADALEAASHARSCRACADDLVDLALGHGLLSSAARMLGPDPLLLSDTVETPLPPPLRRAVAAPRRRLLAGAVAALVLVSGAAVVLRGAWRDTPVQEAPGRDVAAGRTATLVPVGGGAHRPGGRVSMATDTEPVTRMRVDTVDLPRAPRGGFYYVWLFDPQSNKMLPLGQVVPGHRASFDVPSSLVAAYSGVDISLESDDGDPGHSVTSVLRASYAATAPTTPPPAGGS